MSIHVTPENYGKKVDDSFFAFGHVKALFKGPEHLENEVVSSISNKTNAKSIRVFDIILYKDINITNANVIPNELWDSTIAEVKKGSYFHSTLEDQIAVNFSKPYFSNVDFLRTPVYRPECFIKDPVINYSLLKEGYTFGEIEGELYFKVGDPKPVAAVKKPVVTPITVQATPVVPVTPTAPVQPGIGCLGLIMSWFNFSWAVPLVPGGYTRQDAPALQKAGCLWPLLRILGLLFLMLFLLKGCMNYSSTVWEKSNSDAIKNDAKLDIPTGQEKLDQSSQLAKILPSEAAKMKKNKLSDTTFVVPPGNYKLVFFDSNRQDNDKIRLSLNGRELAHSLEIFNSKQEVVLKNMRFGKNIIDFEALSNGKYGICTAEVYLVNMDDGATQMYKFYNVQGFKKRIFIEQH